MPWVNLGLFKCMPWVKKKKKEREGKKNQKNLFPKYKLIPTNVKPTNINYCNYLR